MLVDLPCVHVDPTLDHCAPAAFTRRCAATLFAVAALPRTVPVSAASTVKLEGLRGEGKATTLYPDFTVTDSGLQFKDFKQGTGSSPADGDRVLVDWTGVTVGYQGRYFQTRNKPKGGAFEGDGFLDYLSFKLGDESVIPAVDEAVRSMKAGGIRRIVVPENIGYPQDGFSTAWLVCQARHVLFDCH